MTAYKTQWRVWLILPLLILLSSCGNRTAANNYSDDYLNYLHATQGEPVSMNTVERFEEIFNQLQTEALADVIDQVYADRFYFNDTFTTITDKPALTEYLKQTGEAVDTIEVKIQDVMQSERSHDVYVRWTMTMQFSVMGKEIDSQSVGISHLRYNDAGKIILHHDYWDGVEGFYKHLPVIGFWLKKIKDQL